MTFQADKSIDSPAAAYDPYDVVAAIMAKLEAERKKDQPRADDEPGDDADDAQTPDGGVQSGERANAGEPDDAAQAESDDEVAGAQESAGEQPLYEVVIDGKPERVTLDELRKGYSRQRDYTRKTTALAVQRRALEAERAKLKEVLDTFVQDSESIDPVLAQGRKTDWAKLATEQPEAYAQRYAEFAKRSARLREARTLRQRMAAADHADRSRAMAVYADQQRRELLRRLPELVDPNKRRAVAEELTAYASGLGFSDKEQSHILDHRLLRVFHDASMYHKLRQSKERIAAKRVSASSQTQAPRASLDGAGKMPGKLGALKRNALRTGRLDDIVDSVLAHLEED
jgi:hypothetical protein